VILKLTNTKEILMEVKNVIDIALIAGEILLANGAENYRIEETVAKICKSYDFSGECIVMPNGILISIEDSNGEKVMSMKKVKDKHVDLYRIELINSFSRTLANEPLPYDEAKKKLNEIEKAPNFTMRVRTMAACMTGFIYTLFFNGTVIDGIAAIIICFIVYMLFEKVSQLGFFQFLEFFLAGALIGALSLLANFIVPAISYHNVITGAIMILLPGVVLTNGIKDVLCGDFSAGTAKFFEAMIVITAVGLGIGAALFVGLKGI
jgi:uncharacterized membrane protein YjjP (DUF1212 family)